MKITEEIKIRKRLGKLKPDYSPIWCTLTASALREGYTMGGNGEHGAIVGESRNGKKWWVQWNGITSRYAYYKEYIKLIKS